MASNSEWTLLPHAVLARFPAVAPAQGLSGPIQSRLAGAVTDNLGAIIPGAADCGIYVFPCLPPASHQFSCGIQGFKK